VDALIALQLWNLVPLNGLGHKTIGMQCIDAHPSAADSNDFPGIEKTPSLLVATRDVHHAARLLTTHHAAGIGAVRGDHRATGEPYIGEKTLIASDQGSPDQA